MRTGTAVLLAVLAAPPALLAHPDTPRRLEEVARELQARPGAPDLLYRRGCLLLDEEYADYPQALRDLTAAVDAPGIADARLFRAAAWLRLGRTERALADLDVYLRGAPEDVRGHERRAEAHLAAGRRREAVADLESAVRIQPRADLYTKLAGLHLDLGDAPKAIAAYEQGLARLGRPVELMVALVETAARTRATAKALEWLAVLEAGGGRRERWVLARAEVLEAAGRASEARRAYEEVLSLHEQRSAGGGYLSQAMRLEQALALAGLGRKAEAEAIAAALPDTIQGRAEYGRLQERLAR